MKKPYIFGLLLIAGLTAACGDYTTPGNTAQVAFTALRSNDLKLFRNTLRGHEALQTWGTAEGMANLKNTLSHYKKVFTGNQHVLRRIPIAPGMRRVYYSLDILTKNTNSPLEPQVAAFKVEASCILSFEEESCRTNHGSTEDCRPAAWIQDDCKFTKITQ